MKKILIAATVAASCFAPQVFAQANNFAGFSVAANVNASTATSKLSAPGTSVNMGESSQNASLQAAYGLALGSNFVLGLGGTVALGDMKLGSFTSGATTVALKATEMYSLYIEPGYAVSNSTLVYAKVAYISTKAELAMTGFSTGTKDFDGVGYGIGIRTKLSKNLFLQAEFAQSDYNEATSNGSSFKPSATTGTVGIGYQF